MIIRRQRVARVRYAVVICLFVALILITATKFKHDIERGLDINLKLDKFKNLTSYICLENTTGNGTVEDLLSMEIPRFEANYKNPCFYDSCHFLGTDWLHRLRCLPYFYVIGIDKSGSTDLFSRIVQHPQILGNDGEINKETMWWSWKRYGHWLRKRYERNETLEEYLKYFDTSALHISNSFVQKEGRRYHPIVTGDGTPMDFWDFSGWPLIPQNHNLSEPVVLTPHLMKHVNPKAKLLVILRNPVDRLYSDYLFLDIGTPTAQAFHNAVNSSITYFNNCRKIKGEKFCLFDRSLHISLEARIYVSIYSVYLREWLKVFPREQILILRNEDYAKDIKGHLKKVFKFLDVVDLPEESLNLIAARMRAYKTSQKRIAGPMLKKTRDQLEFFFEKYNLELSKILNDTKFTWSDIRKVEGVDYRKNNHWKIPKKPNHKYTPGMVKMHVPKLDNKEILDGF